MRRSVLLLTAAAGLAFAQATPEISRQVSAVTYQDQNGVPVEATLLTFCTADAGLVGMRVVVNFAQASALANVAPLLKPIPGNWASCYAAVIASPTWVIVSTDVYPIRQDATAVHFVGLAPRGEANVELTRRAQ